MRESETTTLSWTPTQVTTSLTMLIFVFLINSPTADEVDAPLLMADRLTKQTKFFSQHQHEHDSEERL